MLDVYDKLNFDNQDGGVWKQGWRVEYDPYEWNSHHKLKVFLVPHSHNDPGWVKTFDQYFEQQTKAILSNMLVQLIQNPSMTFIWAEISYFSKWFEPLSDTQKQDVKRYTVLLIFQSENSIELTTLYIQFVEARSIGVRHRRLGYDR